MEGEADQSVHADIMDLEPGRLPIDKAPVLARRTFNRLVQADQAMEAA